MRFCTLAAQAALRRGGDAGPLSAAVPAPPAPHKAGPAGLTRGMFFSGNVFVFVRVCFLAKHN